MDPKILRDLNQEILMLKELHFDIHSLLIVKDGYIVAEQYYDEYYAADSLHRIYSCTKSLTSALVGIAISQGYDLEVTSRLPIEIKPLPENISYLKCKKDKMGHLLNLTENTEL